MRPKNAQKFVKIGVESTLKAQVHDYRWALSRCLGPPPNVFQTTEFF